MLVERTQYFGYLPLVGIVFFFILSHSLTFPRCGGSVNFGNPGDRAIISPGALKSDKTFFGEWWAYNVGNPEIGKGHDRGAYVNNLTSDWVEYYAPLNVGFMNVNQNNWFNRGVDGCIVDASGNPYMVVAFDDRSRNGYESFFSIAVVDMTPNTGCEYNFDRVGSDITLVPIPKPDILNVLKKNDVLTIELSWDPPIKGFYKAPEIPLELSDLIAQYEIYYRHSLFLPSDRLDFGMDPEESWVCAGAFKDPQASVKIPVPKRREFNIYFALRLIYDGETPFKSRYVGSSSHPININEDLLLSIYDIRLLYSGKNTFEMKWKFSGDDQILGFNILRSEQPEGDFKKINDGMIRRDFSSSEYEYSFKDRLISVNRQNSFLYRIEALDSNGEVVGISDTVRGVMKRNNLIYFIKFLLVFLITI